MGDHVNKKISIADLIINKCFTIREYTNMFIVITFLKIYLKP